MAKDRPCGAAKPRYLHDMVRMHSLRGALGALMVLVMAVGLGLAGARHHVGDPGLEAAKVAYVLAGGDLSDICGDLGGGDHPDCPLCHLVATADLRDPAALLRDADLRLLASVVLPGLSYAARPPLDPASPPQGPPTV